MTLKIKIFRDPIYGYISIPNQYCLDFIDTPIFQRLRRIEQTSMRVLYPSAHHDRFSHSIGVYHLASIAFEHLYKNSVQYYPKEIISSEQWEELKVTFLIASLLHDCGHSPFSHTFEHFYLYQREKEIKERISSHFSEEPTFSDDYDAAGAAPHEKISALILLENYKDAILRNNGHPLLAARMILGCKYKQHDSDIQRFQNKLISLLNGTGIDVDSLDYIQRDSWASGVSNVNIDYHRLLSSIMIRPDDNNLPRIVFKKQVLSVLENISIGRNFLYKWIYSHHKVNYEQYLLNGVIDKINSESRDEFCRKAFCFESFFDSQEFNGLSYFLPTDDDIIYTLKQYSKTDTRIQEYLSRNYRYKAIWKTHFEFENSYFNDVSEDNRMAIYTQINKGALNKKYGEGNILCLEAKPKLKGLSANHFFIDVDGKFIDASKASNLPNENLSYFIVYVTEEISGRRNEIVKDIFSLQS